MASPNEHNIKTSAPFAIDSASFLGFQPVTCIFGDVQRFSSSPLPIHTNLASGTKVAILLKS